MRSIPLQVVIAFSKECGRLVDEGVRLADELGSMMSMRDALYEQLNPFDAQQYIDEWVRPCIAEMRLSE